MNGLKILTFVFIHFDGIYFFPLKRMFLCLFIEQEEMRKIFLIVLRKYFYLFGTMYFKTMH